jgi:hypothetical protein
MLVCWQPSTDVSLLKSAILRYHRYSSGYGWTETHGHFAIMGGFMAFDGNRPIEVLLPHQLDGYSLTGKGDFPRITKEEIRDKSKDDFISKGLVVLQTAWFIIQCIARGAQHLPVTELEIMTVAFAALNFVIYGLWWNKPQNVERSIRVYRKPQAGEVVEDEGEAAEVELEKAGLLVTLKEPVHVLFASLAKCVRGLMFNEDGDLFPFYSLAQITGGGRKDRSPNVEAEQRVDTFYPGQKSRLPVTGFFSVGIVAVAFGAIHCIAWSFAFPSAIEQNLWRTASLAVTGIPAIFIMMDIFLEDWLNNSKAEALIICPYFFARLVLLVLPFLSLRALPRGAFQLVRWTQFIPHL